MSERAKLRKTIAQVAAEFNVSPRALVMARELLATGRTDLIDACQNGEMSINAALKAAKPEKYGARAERKNKIVKAWRGATNAEKLEFLETIFPHPDDWDDEPE